MKRFDFKHIEMHSNICNLVVMSSYGEEQALTKDIWIHYSEMRSRGRKLCHRYL